MQGAWLMDWLFGANIAWRYPEIIFFAFLAGGIMFFLCILFIYLYDESFRPLTLHALRSFYRPPSRWNYWVAAVSLCGMCIAGGLAMAQPEKKFLVPRIEYEGACVGISLDTSFSMLAPVKRGSQETRLARALQEIEELVRSFPEGDRLALMAFAATAQMFRPAWTTDRNRIFFTQLRSLNASYVMMQGRTGSNLPGAIGAWFGAFPKDAKCQTFALIFTDGEPEGEKQQLDQELISSLEAFAKMSRSVSIFLVAIGDYAEPLRIPEYDSQGRLAGFAVDEKGEFIFSRPNISYLDELAGRFRAKLIFTQRGENLKEKIAEALGEVRTVAAVKKSEAYESISPRFTAAYAALFVLFLVALVF